MKPSNLPVRAVKLMFPLTLGLALWLCQSSAWAVIYKWVDANHQTQYTQEPPPPGVKFTRIETAVPTESDGGNSKQAESPQERAKASDAAKKAQEDAADKEKKQMEIKKIREENCKAAHSNLEQLNRGGQIRYLTSDGQVLHLSDEDRAKRIAEANQQIKDNCGK